MVGTDAPSALPVWRRLLYYGLIILVPIVVIVLMAQPRAGAPHGDSPVRFVVEAVGRLVLGTTVLALAGIGYALAVFTCHFTFDFSRPVFASYKPKAVLVHLLFPAPLVLGLGLFLAGVFHVLFRVAGLRIDSFLAGIVAAVVGVNLGLVRINLWASNETTLPRRRLLAQGVSEADLGRGTYVGISDPDAPRKSRGMLEEDIGMLWIEPDRLVYRGDSDAFTVSRDRLLAIERVVFARSATAYAGNRHIVLRFRTEQGAERRVRLHVEGRWTMGRLVRATDALADQLTTWQEQTAAA